MRNYHLTILFALSAILFISIAVLILNHIIAGSIADSLVISLPRNVTEGVIQIQLEEAKKRILWASVWIMMGLFMGLLSFVIMGDVVAQRANRKEVALIMEKQRAERKGLEEQLLHAQKMESIARLTGGVAHDFNNLLTPIIGCAQMGLSEMPNGHKVHTHLSEIKKAAERAANLTGQLLAFSRRQIIVPKVLNLNSLIADMDQMLRSFTGKDIELVTELTPGLGLIKADPGQIGQVLMNLVVNAYDAISKDGLITIKTANVNLGETHLQQHPEASVGSHVMLSVTDNGSGMTEEVKARIFEPFFTTKEEGKGTGLGLATCFGIVRQSGGYIEVQTIPGQGSTFNVYLPQVEDIASEEVSTMDDSQLRGGSETVLLVEDEESVRELVARLLRDQGYQVLEASNGEEALSVTQEDPEREIHLLLTDLVMPHMAGIELVDRFRSIHPSARVLFMSGYINEGLIDRISSGINASYIQKPFLPTALVRKVRDLMDSNSSQARVSETASVTVC